MTKKQCVEKLRAIFPDFEHDQLDAMVRLIGEIRDGFDIEPEEPLPERLVAIDDEDNDFCDIRVLGPPGYSRILNRREGAEAVRRYNREPALRKLAEEWHRREYYTIEVELLAILDGKEF